MSDADKVTAIIAALQIDAKLLLLVRTIVTNNLGSVTTAQLNNICAILGIQ